MMRLSRNQVRAIDRIAIDEYGIPGIVLMENAARSIVDAISDMLPVPPFSGEIGILCGPGNNGGDGLAVARHLKNRGHDVSVVLTAPPVEYKGDAAINLNIIRNMKGYCDYLDPHEDGTSIFILRECSLIIDAMFGTGLSRPVDEKLANYIEACNWTGPPFECPVISIDVPSGLDCDVGSPWGKRCVRATRTVTLVAEKTGFANPDARQFTGEIVVADIGVPREIIDRVMLGTNQT